EGLKGRFKIIGQVGLGIIVGITLYNNPNVTIRQFTGGGNYVDTTSLQTTVPFTKNNLLDYNILSNYLPESLGWLPYVLICIFIITAVSNAANITDGIDGLAAGTSAIIGVTLAIFAFLSGNKIFAEYLNIMLIPNSGELAIF